MDLIKSKVSFTLTGEDFNPIEITNQTGITPTSFWQKGNPGRYKKVLEYSGWSLTVETGTNPIDVNTPVNEIIHRFFDKIEMINSLKEKFQMNSVLQIVLNIDINPDQPTPFLSHDQKTIEFLFLTRTTTDVDIYRFDSSQRS